MGAGRGTGGDRVAGTARSRLLRGGSSAGCVAGGATAIPTPASSREPSAPAPTIPIPYILMNFQEEADRARLHAQRTRRAIRCTPAFGRTSALPVFGLHDLRRRGGQHVQRAIAARGSSSSGRRRPRRRRPSSPARSIPSGPRSCGKRCSPSSSGGAMPRRRPASRSRSTGSVASTANCSTLTSARRS